MNAYDTILPLLVHGLLATIIVLRLRRRARRAVDPAPDQALRAYLNEYLVMNAFDGLVISDMAGRVEWANPAYLDMQGHKLHEIQGRNPLAFALPPDLTPPQAEIDAFRFEPGKHGAVERATFLNQRPDGTVFHNHISFIITPPDRRFGQKALLVCRDISDQLNAEARLREERDSMKTLAERDPLTGLANRARLMAQMCNMLDGGSGNIGVMQLDLDHFKAVNDAHGHAAGDAVLVHMADVLAEVTGPKDLAARVGGDEFVLLVGGATGPEQLRETAKAISAAMSQPVPWNGLDLNVGCSIGITRASGATSADTLLAEADHALYQVKRDGRGGTCLYGGTVRQRHLAGKTAVNTIRAALEAEGLVVQLDPIHDVRTHRTRSVRMTAHYRHPETGLRPVDSVRELAQSPDVMRRYALALAELAARTAKSLAVEAGRDIGVCMTPPAQAGAHGQLLDRLKWACETAELPAAALYLTFSEAQISALGDQAGVLLSQVTDAGFGVALSDFGAHTAPLAHLLRFPISAIHLAPALTRQIGTDPGRQQLCRAILDTCVDRQIRTVATGLESAAEMEALSKLGCTGFLGPYISAPLTGPEAIAQVQCKGPAASLAR